MPQVVDAPLSHKGTPISATIGARRMSATHADRLAILAGEKTEIRHHAPAAWRARPPGRPPGPCIIYTDRADGLVLTDVIWADTPWFEPLSAISPEGLKAEGFETYEEFLAYMKRRWAPKKLEIMMVVRVTRVRRLTEEDIQAFKDAAYERLYGQYA
jgi:hypothetical protein